MNADRFNAVRFRGGGEALAPLVAASRAEGEDFIAELAAALERGDYAKPRTALFGVYDGALAGVCALVPDPYLEPADPAVGRLRHLYVLPDRRRRGVATALIGAVVLEARRHYRVLRLRTANPAAARLYEAAGFAAITERAATHVLGLS